MSKAHDRCVNIDVVGINVDIDVGYHLLYVDFPTAGVGFLLPNVGPMAVFHCPMTILTCPMWVFHFSIFVFHIQILLGDTARYVGLLLAPAEGFGLFFPFGQEKS